MAFWTESRRDLTSKHASPSVCTLALLSTKSARVGILSEGVGCYTERRMCAPPRTGTRRRFWQRKCHGGAFSAEKTPFSAEKMPMWRILSREIATAHSQSKKPRQASSLPVPSLALLSLSTAMFDDGSSLRQYGQVLLSSSHFSKQACKSWHGPSNHGSSPRQYVAHGSNPSPR